MEPILIIKLLAIVITLILGLIGGFIPYVLPMFKQNSKYLGMLNAFAGGILLSVGLAHILADGVKNLDQAMESKYPLGYILPVCSFTVILLVEKILTDSHKMMHGTRHNHVQCHSEKGNLQPLESVPNEKFELILRCTLNSKKQFICETSRAIQIYTPERRNSAPDKKENIIKPLKESQKLKAIKYTPPLDADGPLPGKSNSYERLDVQEKECKHESHTSHVGVIQFILMTALSVHSVLAGISLGLSSSIDGTISLLIAIAAHKWADVLTMGINLKKSQIGIKQGASFIIPLSLFTPLGVIIGILLSKTSKLLEGILLCLASGTFLYIATTEIIVEEFSVSKNRISKLICFVVGIGMVCLVLSLE